MKFRKFNIDTVLSLIIQCIFSFANYSNDVLYKIPFSLVVYNPKSHITYSYYVSLVSLNLEKLLSLLFFFVFLKSDAFNSGQCFFLFNFGSAVSSQLDSYNYFCRNTTYVMVWASQFITSGSIWHQSVFDISLINTFNSFIFKLIYKGSRAVA